jgi:hypothetical protein
MPGYKKERSRRRLRRRRIPKDGTAGAGQATTLNQSGDGLALSESCSESQVTESTLPASSNNTTLDDTASSDNEWEDSCFTSAPKAVDLVTLSDVNEVEKAGSELIEDNKDVADFVTTPASASVTFNDNSDVPNCVEYATVEDILEECQEPYVGVGAKACPKIVINQVEVFPDVQQIYTKKACVKENQSSKKIVTKTDAIEVVVNSETSEASSEKASSQESPTSSKIDGVKARSCAYDSVAQFSAKTNSPPKTNPSPKTNPDLCNKKLCLSMMCDDLIPYNTALIKDAEIAYYSRFSKV